MPLPTPELVDKVERMLAGDVEELARVERYGRDAEDSAGEVDEGND